MKAHSPFKKSPIFIGIIILLALLFFLITIGVCLLIYSVVKPVAINSSFTASAPGSDDYSVTPTVGDNNAPPVQTFTLQNVNKIAPEDVLDEVNYGGPGGYIIDFDCRDEDIDYPGILVSETDTEAEWLGPIDIYVSGWPSDKEVSVTANLPNGDVRTDTVKVYPSGAGIRQYREFCFPFIHYRFLPNSDSPVGIYEFSFSGKSGTVKHSVNVTIPYGPRMFYVDDIHSYYLYGFLPNEQIRFFLYEVDPHASSPLGCRFGCTDHLIAWQTYEVDSNGNLIINVDLQKGPGYVIGDISGPVGPAERIIR